MSIRLSRQISGWMYTKPGPIYGATTEDVFTEVRTRLAAHMNVKPETIDLPTLEQLIDILGYKPIGRINHGYKEGDERPQHYWMLALPERSING